MTRHVQPTLIIGLGGTGTMAASEIKRLAYERYLDPKHPFPLLRFLAIDTEFMTAPDPAAVRKRYRIEGVDSEDADSSFEESFEIALDPTERYLLEAVPDHLQAWLKKPKDLQAEDFVKPEFMDDVAAAVKGNGAGGFGIVGKLALWQHLDQVINVIRTQLQSLNNDDELQRLLDRGYGGKYARSPNGTQFNVFVICSLTGGTGKGIFLPVAVAVRELLEQLHIGFVASSERYLVNFNASCFQVRGRNVGRGYLSTLHANQYCSMTELEHALSNGCPVEQKLHRMLNLPAARKTSAEIYTNVLNVSAQKHPSGAYVGDYATVNRAVAETILAYTFGGLVDELRAYFSSNRGSFISTNPVREAAAPQAKRSRSYGRIGRYKLTFPVDQLFRYAKVWHAKELLEDILKGHLGSVAPEQRERPTDFARKLVSPFLGDARSLLPPPASLAFEQITAQCANFDDPWLARIQEAVGGRHGAVSSELQPAGAGRRQTLLEQRREELIGSHLSGHPERGDGIRPKLTNYLCEYGIDLTRETIEWALHEIGDSLSTEFSEEIRSVSSGATDRFRFVEHSTALLQFVSDLVSSAERRVRDVQQGGDEEHQRSQTALHVDEAQWRTENDTWLKKMGVVRQGSKRISAATSRALRAFVERAARECDAYHEAMRRFAFLGACVELCRCFDGMIANLDGNGRALRVLDENRRVSGGLILQYRDRCEAILREQRDSLERRIVGSDESEFIKFAKSLRAPDGSTLPSQVQRHTNPNMMPKLLSEVLEPAAIEAEVIAPLAVLDRVKRDYSICGQLNKMIQDGHHDAVRGLLSQLRTEASFLGVLDPSKVEGGNPLVGQGRTIVQAEDTRILNDFATVFQQDSLNRVPYEGREEIILTAFENALPVFVFSEFYRSQQIFREIAGDNPVKARHERHTHPEFIQAEEPFGNVTQLSVDEIAMFINVLQHTGVVRLDDRGYISCAASDAYSPRDHYVVFRDTRKAADGVPEKDIQLHVDELITHINQEGEWFRDLSERLRRRLRVIFVHGDAKRRKEAAAYLKRYVTREDDAKGFPFFPHAFVSYVRLYPDDDSMAHQDLARFLDEHQAQNARKAEHLRKNRSESSIVARTRKDLDRIFDAPQLTHFQIQVKAAKPAAREPKAKAASGKRK